MLIGMEIPQNNAIEMQTNNIIAVLHAASAAAPVHSAAHSRVKTNRQDAFLRIQLMRTMETFSGRAARWREAARNNRTHYIKRSITVFHHHSVNERTVPIPSHLCEDCHEKGQSWDTMERKWVKKHASMYILDAMIPPCSIAVPFLNWSLVEMPLTPDCNRKPQTTKR